MAIDDKVKSGDGEYIEITGTVETIIFTNETNGYTVCELDTGDAEPVTVVGIMPYLAPGEVVRAFGVWQTHASYGKQFKAEGYEKALPVSVTMILKYLSSNAVKGVGPVMARRIVDRFGEDTFDVIEHHPDWLSDIQGISAKKAREISESFISQFGMRSIMMLCREYFGPETIVKIYKKWGSAAVDLLKENPYLTCEEINGVGFVKADRFAMSLGTQKDSMHRIKAGICYALFHNATQNGHVFIPTDRLVALSADLLETDKESVERALALLDIERKTVTVKLFGKSCTYLASNYDAEKGIAKKLELLSRTYERVALSEIETMINRIQFEEGIEYAGAQRRAIIEAINNGVMILTGGPGTGKTTIIKAVATILERLGFTVAMAAPTGRAAKRMSLATSHEAKTVHRLLEAEYIGGEGTKFRRDENNLLDESVIIVDEMSMIDTSVMYALLRAVKPGARIMLIGDPDQLPSVGAGNVLCDLIASDCFATVKLTEIFRQASESRIVTNAHAINHGEVPILTDKKSDFIFVSREDEATVIPTIINLCLTRLPKRYGEDILSRIQVITPSHKGAAGTDILNMHLQSALNPSDKRKKEKKLTHITYREGDKVMQTRNNYELEWQRGREKGVGIYNGDIGRIVSIDNGSSSMIIDFDERICEYPFETLDELEHAYAITVHKSQGSEYPFVILPLYRSSPRLLTRNLFYTAVTRAQSMVILVGSSQVIQEMVQNNRITARYTSLKYYLNGEA